MKPRHIDVLVIGGGVVGCSILRELSRYDATVALLDRRLDVGDATSKANSAIVHTGFDAPPGSLEARLLAESRQLWPDVVEDLHIPYLQTGALMVAFDETDLATIDGEIIPKATQNGVALQSLTGADILDGAPYVNPRVAGGAFVEGEGVIDPFWTTRAYCESAIRNGAEVMLGHTVTAITAEPGRLLVQTSEGATFVAAMVVNAAGLWADEVARLAGDTSFHLTPRKGQFIITEHDNGVAQIILPVPSKISKGMLVTPIVFGGVLLGPTAEDIADKNDVSTTPEGLQRVREGVKRLVPSMAVAPSVRQFAGLRAVSSTGDYIIRPSTVSPRLLHVAGIRSTGLSASPGIGRYVAALVRDELGLPARSFVKTLPEHLSDTRADEGDVVCLCRSITRGEVLAALRGPLPPTTLDGLKRRTGAMLGDCQGNICIPTLLDLFHAHRGSDQAAVEKNVPGSAVVAGRVTEEEATA